MAVDGTISCIHSRGGATAADDGRNGSGRQQQFIPFIFYSLATTSFIVLIVGEAREIWEHFQ